MHVDRPGPGDCGDTDATREHLGESPAPAGAQNKLRGVHAACEGQQCLGDVIADDLVVGAAHVLDQGALSREVGGVGSGEALVVDHVDGEQVGSAGTLGDAGRAADEGVAFGATGEGDHDALAGFPGAFDVMVAAVPVELLVDFVGQPQQGELAQGGEIADSEVVAQGGVDHIGLVDVAVGHAPAQGFGSHVDEFNLFGGPDYRVGDGFVLGDAGDLLNDVVEGLEVLDVDRCDDVDARFEDRVDILPTLLVAAARHVGVRHLVDQSDFGPPRDHGVEVHLVELGTPVGHLLARHALETLGHLDRQGSVVRFDVPDDDIGAPGLAPLTLLEHPVRLADPGRGAEVDAQLPARCHCRTHPSILTGPLCSLYSLGVG